MLVVLEESDGIVLGIRVGGRITKAGFEAVARRSERIIEEHGGVRLLVHVERLGGIEPAAFWADLKFSLHHFGDLDRLALVGDARWHAPYVTLIKPFLPAPVRHYPCREIESAWRWLFEGNTQGLTPLRVARRRRRPLRATEGTLARRSARGSLYRFTLSGDGRSMRAPIHLEQADGPALPCQDLASAGTEGKALAGCQ